MPVYDLVLSLCMHFEHCCEFGHFSTGRGDFLLCHHFQYEGGIFAEYQLSTGKAISINRITGSPSLHKQGVLHITVTISVRYSFL